MDVRGAEGLTTEVRYLSDQGSAVVTTLGAVDIERVAAGLPVRQVRSHAGDRHYCGWFWSATNCGHVSYESRLELDRLWLADFDPEVRRISAQPMWLCGRDGGAVRRHVPDLLLRCRDGSTLVVDVKPQRLVDRPEVAAVLAWTGQLCREAGWTYEVWSSEDPVRMANIRWLGQARRPGVVRPELVAVVLEAWWPGCTVADAKAAVESSSPGGGATAAVLQALWSGLLMTDLSRPLEGRSLLLKGADRVRCIGS